MSASLAAFLRSFVFAFDGIAHVVRTQRNMRVHMLVAALVTLLGVWVRLSPTEWAICALTMGVVFAAEILNTVIESLVDLASPDHHDLAKIAKDAAAGAVLVLAIFATLVGIFIMLPKLLLVAGR